MNIEQIKSTINDAENRFNVENWDIEGVKIWPFIRIENYMHLSYQSVNAKVLKTKSFSYAKRILWAKFMRFYRYIFNDFYRNKAGKADIVLLSSGITYVELNNLFYEKISDPIADFYKQNNISTKRFDLDYLFPSPLYSPSSFIQPDVDNIIITSMIKSKFTKQVFENEIWDDYQDFINDPAIIAGFSKVPTKQEIRIKIGRIILLRDFFVKKLERLKPKVAFVECYYSDISMAYVLACEKLSITTIDLQHGVQGDLHLAYGSWKKIPLNGYNSLPNFFWVWSEEEATAINSWNKKVNNHKVVVGGNLFSDFWKNEQVPIVKSMLEEIELVKPNFDKHTILLTLSPFTEGLMENTWDVVKQSQYEYNWFIRLHPAMISDIDEIIKDIKKRGIFNFQIEKISALPLYPILRKVDLHITSQSSCVIEAFDFGLTSIVTSEYGASLYSDLITKGNVIFVSKVDDILNSIKKLFLGDRKSMINTEKKDYAAFLMGFLNTKND